MSPPEDENEPRTSEDKFVGGEDEAKAMIGMAEHWRQVDSQPDETETATGEQFTDGAE